MLSEIMTKEEKSIQKAAYFQKHKVRLMAKSKEWAKNNPEKMAAAAAKRKELNKIKNKIYFRKLYLANRDAKKAKSRQQYAKNPARWKRCSAEWLRKHPEKRKFYKRNRRARLSQAGCLVSGDLIQRLFTSQSYRCVYCLKAITEKYYHADHKTPLSRGGQHSDENIHLTCPSCNQRKSTKTHEEFLVLCLP
jgi:5-methylcytosine-specific restriction endonuclease McrA